MAYGHYIQMRIVVSNSLMQSQMTQVQLITDDYVVALTDKNILEDILPTYKSNRNAKRKPLV